LRTLLIAILAEHHVVDPEAVADAILERLSAAPEEIRVEMLRHFMHDPQCLICGDMLD
jgi:hypothetical protein